MDTPEQVIDQTKKWINEVVIGCNFCPFAAQVVKKDSALYKVENASTLRSCLESFLQVLTILDEDDSIETAFLIFPNSFAEFDDYLDLVSVAEDLLTQKDYDGIYQLASFHPLYRFADSTNTTNLTVTANADALKQPTEELVNALVADKLIEKENFSLKLIKGKLTINDKELAEEVNAKYSSLISALDGADLDIKNSSKSS